MRRRWLRYVLLWLALAALVAASVVPFATGARRAAAPATSEGGPTTGGGRGHDWPAWGVSHRRGAEPVTRAVPQNLTVTPGEPAAALDRRLRAVRAAGGTPVVTVCCGGDAALAAGIARRHPELRHFVVGNDLRSFTRARWDAAAYTGRYNAVYAALKDVNPAIRVGGPSTPMPSVAPAPAGGLSGAWGGVEPRALEAVRYWLTHKIGADFVAVDGAAPPEHDPGLDPFTAVEKFGAVTQWLTAHSDGDLPVWWDGWTAGPAADPGDPRRDALHAAALIQFARGGATAALHAPAADPPSAPLLGRFGRWFPPGTTLLRADAADPRVHVLAQPAQTVAVNTAAEPVTTRVGRHDLRLARYEVRWIDG
ncbi:hypothetical protein [Actinomadura flavalba]|uniref:hypothetical protein n=1 Tax=Actinomadura flavalba TaxID=1120938 RepID=UPI00037B1D48|nr:hypothetical protein [Actinomadura flavalba]